MTKVDAQQFAELAVQLHRQPDVAGTVDELLAFTVAALGCDHAGAMLVHPGRQIETAAATTSVVAKADQLQLEYDEGPCVSVIEDRPDVLVIDDTAADDRWPTWGSLVSELGLRSILSLALTTGSATIGALNLYASTAGHFQADDAEAGRLLAQVAGVAIDSNRRQAKLRVAVDSQTKIGQAMGILMARHDLDADQAFALMRRYSQDNNIRLRDVVQHIVDTSGA